MIVLFIVLSVFGGANLEPFIGEGNVALCGEMGDSPSPSVGDEGGEMPWGSGLAHGRALIGTSWPRDWHMLILLPSWGLYREVGGPFVVELLDGCETVVGFLGACTCLCKSGVVADLLNGCSCPCEPEPTGFLDGVSNAVDLCELGGGALFLAGSVCVRGLNVSCGFFGAPSVENHSSS